MKQTEREEFARRLMDRVERVKPAISVLASLISAELIDSHVFTSGAVAGELAHRIEVRVRSDGALHLSSIVDECVAFESASKPGFAEAVARHGGRVWDSGRYEINVLETSNAFQCDLKALAETWLSLFNKNDKAKAARTFELSFGVDLASEPDRTVIHGFNGTIVACDDCGTRYVFEAQENMPATCRCCGAPFKGKEVGV